MKELQPQLIFPFPEWQGKVQAAFSTRMGGRSTGVYSELNLGFRSGDNPEDVHANWNAIKKQLRLDEKPVVLPKMIHGDVLANADVDAEVDVDAADGADAIYSRKTDCILAVTMADCLTALIFDPVLKTIAAVHAGWRGTRLNILYKTLQALEAKGFINPCNTWIAFGPCLRPESLEVGESVALQLEPKFVADRDGKFFFDLPACNKDQALRAGIPNPQIRDMGGNTLLEPDRYFSYRRDGPSSGRLAAFISLC